MGGLGLGPLIAGLSAQYAPDPTTLVFEVYLAVLAVAGLSLLLVPETVSPRRRPAVRFAGLGIPERAGASFSPPRWPGSLPSPCSACSVRWCPASSQACCTRAATPCRVPLCFCCSRWEPSPRSRCRGSAAAWLCWPGLFLVALALIPRPWPTLRWRRSWLGRSSAGRPWARSSWAAWPRPTVWPRPGRRGQAISAFFVACYAGLIIPVVGVGVLSGFIGIFLAVLAFSLLLAVLCLFSVESIRRTR